MARTLLVLALLTAAAPLSVDIYTPSLPLLLEDLAGPGGTREWLAQASITSCLLGIGLGQLLWGPLSDRVGRRPVILVGAIGWTITSVLSAVSATPEMLIAVRALAGLAGAAGIVVARSIVRDISENTRAVSSRIGVLSLVTAIAPVLAPVIGAAIASVAGWRADFVALTVFGAIVACAFALTAPETLPPSERATGTFAPLGALIGAARNRELAFVALALAAFAFGFYAYVATASFIVETELGYPPVIFALVFASNACAMLLANLGFRRIVRRWHPSVPLGIGLAVCAGSGALLAIVAAVHGPAVLLWGASMVFAAGAGFVLPGAHSWGQATLAASGAASALTGAAQFFGGMLGSPVTGVLGVTTENLGMVIGASSGLGLIVWVAARRSQATATTRTEG